MNAINLQVFVIQMHNATITRDRINACVRMDIQETV